MPGHASRDRMDAVADLDAVVDQCLAELDALMLCLGGGESVARHDDNLAGVRQLQRGIVDRDLADASGGAGRPLACSSPVPKPPAMMLVSERFMASAMSLVRMPPAARTRAPAMISGMLSTTKPAIATALPVNAFSSEMTTGMSAPPIGSVARMPSPSAARVSTTSTGTPP